MYVIGDFFSTEKRPALSVELWDYFVDLVAAKEGHRISYPRGSNGWSRELGFALTFLKWCDGDIDVALETMTQLFQMKSLKWRSRTSIKDCLNGDFNVAVVAAKKVIDHRRAQEATFDNTNALQLRMPILCSLET